MTREEGVRGVFISFEGGDGAGKSTQIKLLADAICAAGRNVVVTREPGGSDGAEAIRDLLVTGSAERWSPITEALLMNAARADHLEKTILPALRDGCVVITDRFADSTMAYQGIAGALGNQTVRTLLDLVVGNNMPVLTIILDLPVDAGLGRADARADGQGDNSEDRFEAKGQNYQARVRDAFLQIARENPERCAVIDASGTIDEVALAIRAIVAQRLPALFSSPK